MPKIIDGVKDSALEKARQMVLDGGYSAVTMRAIAARCGVAVGTLYNYYPSKEILVASFLAKDWLEALKLLKLQCATAQCAREVLAAAYGTLTAFKDRYVKLFLDKDAAKCYGEAYRLRHAQLREQVSAIFSDTFSRIGICADAFKCDFVAEALVTWSVEGKDFDSVADLLEKLI